MAGNENTQLRVNEVPAKTRRSLERGENFVDGGSATLAHILGRRLRLIYPLDDPNDDEPPALRNLIEELAAKDV